MAFVRATAAVLFVAGIAIVLSIPILTAERDLILHPTSFDGLVGITISVGSAGSSTKVEATLGEGSISGTPWALHASESDGTWCYSFRTGVVAADLPHGLVCTEVDTGGSGTSQFIPASEELERSVYVSALPGDIEELRVRATDDLPLDGGLYELDSHFEADALVLVVFLPPGTDLTYVRATDQDGRRVDVSRIVDQVDAY